MFFYKPLVIILLIIYRDDSKENTYYYSILFNVYIFFFLIYVEKSCHLVTDPFLATDYQQVKAVTAFLFLVTTRHKQLFLVNSCHVYPF